LTNPEVLAVDQHSSDSRPVISTDKVIVWRSKFEHGYYVAAFNISDSTQKLNYKWSELGIDGASYKLRDLWQRKDLGAADSLAVELPSHASVLYSVVTAAKKAK
jgi:alpha-galactosidase